ncbi:F0F1 ATP synthase subunit delta [Campylobacter sp. JMF_01 NE2]|uniref:F0F1 ATP synthase subunit delta n=1 Tax=unclassified Campylobacter TaxID=2593542 RepID=UPI0022E9B6C9|nr:MULTISPECIES: F0F1 ATP synthase subunit delta [unclassified Campylobacter]MDA3043158.1 F0F1 ATP synthase subunit delta [Campylobacter sp. JMF_09 ED2]MDA3044804.1 F0F1 ATP synthase subunit delta [Campylobacter sp. JMF_07 ED4]MDA3045931.1 F0F1 ATP synthase subunit delta [Campylobacter sp. VBCF_06 NA8]MDA3047462.1 F0F1 ATP synthase subunit delta [Campylobacter sp. JMF_08 NE1]MDA3049675.1 F0F1 ATP synthase subunit delta [Campylobacter sp. JMF_15 NE4]
MIDNTAKKYVSALIKTYKKDELGAVLGTLETISSAFKVSKFGDIIKSPTIKDADKVNLILSFIKDPSDKIVNFIKFLAKNRRIGLIPQITDDLRKNISAMDNKFHGKIYSNQDISEDKIKDLQGKISKKFNAEILLELVKCDYEGIKIEVEDLGFEISFSIDRLKQKMSEYILKAI